VRCDPKSWGEGTYVPYLRNKACPLIQLARTALSRQSLEGHENVQHRFYPKARHELFNETNWHEVVSDFIE
jgi:hypothetical protein